MTVLSKFADAMEFNADSLMQENYDWVDKRLDEMYNGYALTSANCDEYEAADLLNENYAWVDERLAEMCAMSIRDKVRFSCRLPISWSNYRNGPKLECIEDGEKSSIGRKRNRSEFDISDYEVEVGRAIKRLRCQSPIHSGKYIIANSVYDEEVSIESEVSTLIDEDTLYNTEEDDDSEISCYDIGYDSY